MARASDMILRRNRSGAMVAAAAAFSVTTLWFWLTWRYGFDLSDEGFYWYGAQRVLRGEVPLRDFMSYDIGRYYWAAFFMRVLGDDGLFAARLSATAYQFFGTFCGTYLCLLAGRDDTWRWPFALLVACILTVWAVPYYKAYDHATSIVIIAMVVFMLKVQKPAAWLGAGVGLGLAAVIGRNHGVYGAFAAVLAVSVLFAKTPSRRDLVRLCACFLLGVILGFLPNLIMMLVVDGYYGAFIDSLVKLFRSGATNIELPVPWPWSTQWEWNGVLWTALKFSTGAGFVFLIAMPLLGALALARGRFDLNDDARKVVFAAVVCAIPYTHYALSRGDLTHLALGIFPTLIGVLAAIATLGRMRTVVLSLGILGLSVVTMSNLQAYFSPLVRSRVVAAKVAEQHVWVYPAVSDKLRFTTNALAGVTPGTGTFLAIPNLPSLYAIYRTRMPIWEIYPLFAKDAEFEAREIKRLESALPQIVLLSDHALDGDPERRYSRLHPLVFAWIVSRYELSGDGASDGYPDLKIYSLKR